MWIFIQPNDTLFFRDGRPFNAGSDVWTGAIFPPYPPTLYGMLRTLLVHLLSSTVDYSDFFSNVPERWKEVLGTAREVGTLSIRGPFAGEKAGERATLWLSAPADLWQRQPPRRRKPRHHLLQPDRTMTLDGCSDLETPFHPLSFHKVVDGSELDPSGGLIGGNGLSAYLEGQQTTSGVLEGIDTRTFWHEEPGTLIERDESLSVKRHQLAHPSHTRMQDGFPFLEKGFLVRIDVPEGDLGKELSRLLAGPSIARLGGKGRVSIVSKAEVGSTPQKLTRRISETGHFRVVLTSPGFFPNRAYYPDFLAPPSEHDSLPEGEWTAGGEKRKVRLKAMVTGGRPARIGGWNLAEGRPKDMFKAVPAGSVYFFELDGFDAERDGAWVSALVASCSPGTFPECGDDTTRQGFNTILIGGWDYVST